MYYENEMYHHGVKGMHWGVRRYTNSSGSLNSAGKRQSKKAARSYFKAQNYKMNAENSFTSSSRKKYQKKYDKAMRKVDRISDNIGKDNLNYGKEKVAGFRSKVFKVKSAGMEASRKITVGASIVAAASGVALTALNPALAPVGAAYTAAMVMGAAGTNWEYNRKAPTMHRSRQYYSDEYKKAKNANK